MIHCFDQLCKNYFLLKSRQPFFFQHQQKSCNQPKLLLNCTFSASPGLAYSFTFFFIFFCLSFPFSPFFHLAFISAGHRNSFSPINGPWSNEMLWTITNDRILAIAMATASFRSLFAVHSILCVIKQRLFRNTGDQQTVEKAYMDYKNRRSNLTIKDRKQNSLKYQ